MPDQEFFSIKGKKTIVTGGAQGIGRAISERFADAGAEVTIFDIQDATELAESIGAQFIKVDVSVEQAVETALKQVAEKSSGLDTLINNAGIQPFGPSIEDQDSEIYDTVFKVNVNSVFYALKHAPKYLKNGGTIINMASAAGFHTMRGLGAYGAGKAAIIQLTKTAAVELAERGIRVNCIAPGITATPIVTDDPNQEEIRLAKKLVPLGRVGEPEEIAALVHYLISPEAAYMTGQCVSIDGGMALGFSDGAVKLALKNES